MKTVVEMSRRHSTSSYKGAALPGSVAAALQPPRRGDSANISHLRGTVMNNINVPFAGPAEPERAPPSLPSSTPCATLHAQPHRSVCGVTWSAEVGSWSIVGLIT